MEKSCSSLIHFDKGTPALEGSDVVNEVDAMKKAVMLLLSGEILPQLFITVVRYLLPSEDHAIQKLLLLCLEIKLIPKKKALASPNLHIGRKPMDIALELHETLMNTELEKNREYRQILVQAIHSCAIEFPEVAALNAALAVDMVVFVRETIETNPKLKVAIIARLLDTIYQIRGARGEVESGVATVQQCLGDLLFFRVNEKGDVADTLRSAILTCVFFLGAVVACTLAKLLLRLEEVQPSKIVLCIRLLHNTGDEIRRYGYSHAVTVFVKMLANKQSYETEEIKAKAQISHGMSQVELEDEVPDDLKLLNRILQLTGFSDPVYAESYVTVHQYDIVLDVTVINRTQEPFQNMWLELATVGDLKLVEYKQIRANIKVTSTQTGVIFGKSSNRTSNVTERTVVLLSDIYINIMEYISPATCADVVFSTMWAEFEWEIKEAVNMVIQDAKDFLNHIIKSTTNLKCLTAPSALYGDCGFLAANFYVNALVNVSIIEQQIDGKLSGYTRDCPQFRG
ncbi:hypothetical protein MKW94_009907 [Papaver nudicaule]|uniref:Coatomer beta subunit n=1 Tax=Papaver nudicaule TaxID=74823 RepID=A0AA41V878_PAPNU|nr:hypothetical protein [Papaver nudicaule]